MTQTEKQKPKIEIISRLPTFQHLVDEAKVYEVTHYLKEIGHPLKWRAAVFPGLLSYLIPRSEDQVKGYTMLDMLDQLATRFREAAKQDPDAKDIVFELSLPSFVKFYDPKKPEIEAKMRRRSQDTKLKIHATVIPESMLLLKYPALLFGLKA